MNALQNLTITKIAILALAIIGAISAWTALYRVDATEVIVFQAPFTGTLTVESQPGTYFRLGSSIREYRKQDNYSFEWAKDDPKTPVNEDKSIPVQFNDGGRANIGGNIQWEMPTDKEHVLALHVLYGSQENVDRTLIRNAINRAMIFTAPLMSATESYAARRAEFLTLFADQLEHGVYEMRTTESRQQDPVTGEYKTVKVVSIARDASGLPIRAEESPLIKFGIKIQAPAITHIVYEDKVEAQIQQQRDNILAIQTAQAQARRADQDRITAESAGQARAAEAKWAQEVLKAKAVTEAEQAAAVQKIDADRNKVVAETNANRDKQVAETAAQRDLEVQTLKARTAEQYKVEQTRIGEGDAARRQAVMVADGALTQKLDAWSKAQEVWAAAFAKYQGDVVPRVMSGGASNAGPTNAAADFMAIMGIKAANDLSLDMKINAPASKSVNPEVRR